MIQDHIREIKAEVYLKQSEVIKLQAVLIDELYGLLMQHLGADDEAAKEITSRVEYAEKLRDEVTA